MLLEAHHLTKYFPRKEKGVIKALDDVSLGLREEETLGIVGESGSGKSTLGRCLLMLLPPTTGRVVYRGEEVRSLGGKKLLSFKKDFQIVFQDPYNSLNPVMTIATVLSRPLRIHGLTPSHATRERIEELLRMVDLDPEMMDRFPQPTTTSIWTRTFPLLGR